MKGYFMEMISTRQLLSFANVKLELPRAIDYHYKSWSALDILKFEKLSPEKRLWVVLREELINSETLHKFSQWCAQYLMAGYEGVIWYPGAAKHLSNAIIHEIPATTQIEKLKRMLEAK